MTGNDREWNGIRIKGKATLWWFRDRGIASEVAGLVGIGIEVPGSSSRFRNRSRGSGIEDEGSGIEVEGRRMWECEVK